MHTGTCPESYYMKNQNKDFQLTSEQKTRLLDLGLGSEQTEEPTDSDEKKSDLLYEILKRPLPLDDSVFDTLPLILQDQASNLSSISGKALWDLLLDSETDLTVLNKIKNFAKREGKAVKSEEESDVFLVIYYASIACALLYHQDKITRHTDENLDYFFSFYTDKSWIPPDLVNLFITTKGKIKSC